MITIEPQVETLTRTWFLDNMVAYYSEDPENRRSVGIQGCLYRAEDGSKCAIGRWIPDDKYNPRIEGTVASASCVFSCLPEQVCELGDDFLASVQNLHDQDPYWNKTGLSKLGREQLATIRSIYYC